MFRPVQQHTKRRGEKRETERNIRTQFSNVVVVVWLGFKKFGYANELFGAQRRFSLAESARLVFFLHGYCKVLGWNGRRENELGVLWVWNIARDIRRVVLW